MARRPSEALRDDYYYDYNDRDNINNRDRNDNYNKDNKNQERAKIATRPDDEYNDYDYIVDDKVSYKERRDDGNNTSTMILAILSGVVILAIVLFLAKSPVFNQKTDVSLDKDLASLDNNSTKYIPNVVEDFELDNKNSKVMDSETAFDMEDPLLEDQKDFVLKTDEDIMSMKTREDFASDEEFKTYQRANSVDLGNSDRSIDAKPKKAVSINENNSTPKKAVSINENNSTPKKANNPSKSAVKSNSSTVNKSNKNIPTTPEAPAVYENVTAYWIQVATYASLESAREVRELLVGRGFNPQIESVKTDKGLVYKVKIGAFGTSEEADRFLDGVRKIEGLDKAIINNVASKKRVI